jgi:hypothetical protein
LTLDFRLKSIVKDFCQVTESSKIFVSCFANSLNRQQLKYRPLTTAKNYFFSEEHISCCVMWKFNDSSEHLFTKHCAINSQVAFSGLDGVHNAPPHTGGYAHARNASIRRFSLIMTSFIIRHRSFRRVDFTSRMTQQHTITYSDMYSNEV